MNHQLRYSFTTPVDFCIALEAHMVLSLGSILAPREAKTAGRV
jgi:hypothetical protein